MSKAGYYRPNGMSKIASYKKFIQNMMKRGYTMKAAEEIYDEEMEDEERINLNNINFHYPTIRKVNRKFKGLTIEELKELNKKAKKLKPKNPLKYDTFEKYMIASYGKDYKSTVNKMGLKSNKHNYDSEWDSIKIFERYKNVHPKDNLWKFVIRYARHVFFSRNIPEDKYDKFIESCGKLFHDLSIYRKHIPKKRGTTNDEYFSLLLQTSKEDFAKDEDPYNVRGKQTEESFEAIALKMTGAERAKLIKRQRVLKKLIDDNTATEEQILEFNDNKKILDIVLKGVQQGTGLRFRRRDKMFRK